MQQSDEQMRPKTGRQAVYDFLMLPLHERYEVLNQFGLYPPPSEKTEMEKTREGIRKVIEAGKVKEFAAEVERRTALRIEQGWDLRPFRRRLEPKPDTEAKHPTARKWQQPSNPDELCFTCGWEATHHALGDSECPVEPKEDAAQNKWRGTYFLGSGESRLSRANREHAADLARVTAERDEAVRATAIATENGNVYYRKMCTDFQRAEAAEAESAKLREALKRLCERIEWCCDSLDDSGWGTSAGEYARREIASAQALLSAQKEGSEDAKQSDAAAS